MPTVEANIQTKLGALCAGRCYPLINPAPVLGQSYIVFQEIFGRDMMITPPEKQEYRVQIDVYAATYGSVKTLAASAKSAMDNATEFATSMIDRFDGYEEISKEYRQTLEYYIWPK
jgi:hypothetical protein